MTKKKMKKMKKITEQDYDEAIEHLWDLIFKMRECDERELGEAQEWVSMQLIEVTNLAWMIGKQSMSDPDGKIDSTNKKGNN
jgi:phosphate uptake regulator